MSKSKPVKKNKAQKNGLKTIPFPYVILLVITSIVYSPSVNSGFTELDDKIFIVEQEQFIRDASNIIPSYRRGTFSEKNDNYFRPVLLNSFIINYQFSGTNIRGYHIFNILLHLISVGLLFWLFSMLFNDQVKAFLLTLIFAVHPVLTQAVAWIPGRNDSLLFIFSILFLIAAILYVRHKKPVYLGLQFVTLLMALFTKETAVLVAPGCFLILLTYTSFNWRSISSVWQYGTWLAAGIIWFLVRSGASLRTETIDAGEFPSNVVDRSPLLLQYLGKILLPFELSVFPMIRDTSFFYGAAALVLITLLILLAHNRNNKRILAGFGWYIVLLIPVVLLPSSINNQDFEHRLYLPIIGILIVLGESALFQSLKRSQTIMVVLLVSLIFTTITIRHQKNFTDPVTFWGAAARTTPNSAYAVMNYGSRMDDVDFARSVELLKRAYELNPDERYINFYMGRIAMEDDSLDRAARYFYREIELSAWYETYFYLSQVEFFRKNLDTSIVHLEKFLEYDPDHPQSIINLTLMLLETGQKDKARNFVESKQRQGIQVPPELIERVKRE